MSIPAIASATRLGVGTAHRSLHSTFPDGKVAQPAAVTGVNGKTYSATRAPAIEPEIVDAELVDEPARPEPSTTLVTTRGTHQCVPLLARTRSGRTLRGQQQGPHDDARASVVGPSRGPADQPAGSVSA
jgi:hypothetical protein